VLGTNPALPAILRENLAFGAFFSDDSSMTDKVVLGSRAAAALYDEHVPLGQTLSVLGHQFIVVGILNDVQSALLSADVDFNNAIFLPYATALAITNNNSPVYEILARPSDQTDMIISRLQRNLLAAHGGQHDFSVLRPSQTEAVTDEVLGLLTVLVGGVAAIALLVGGVGIMNVMLVAITERMHEIGIRKALGATDRQILTQFMTEAAVLSLSGGLVGLLLSFLIAGAIALVTSLTPVITWQAVAVAAAVSVGVGILFGSVPALKAARKDPIAALRNE
jgi:putative ABC transport system permease protein